jgi:hypothetical protein
MPRIELIPEVFHAPQDLYHFHYDNLPLENILERQKIINSAVDNNSETLRESTGTQGSLSNRLAQSINDDGSLRTTAVDSTLHNIGAHTDGVFEDVDYVRMMLEERDKLALISDEATALKIQFNTASVTALFEDTTVEVTDSDTVTWEIIAPNMVRAHMAFPQEAAHGHNYDFIPVSQNIITPDYKNYKTTSISTPFIEGSLRVYINGIKLSETSTVYVIPASGPNGTWKLIKFTPNASAGMFALSASITSSDIIRIDFDIEF